MTQSMPGAGALTPGTTVNEAVQRFPETLAVFSEAGIDACCGGALPIDEAARRHGLDVPLLLRRLAAVADAASPADPR